MNKLLIFFPFLLFASYIKFPYTIHLQKDEAFKMKVYYLKKPHLFKMRWTLYINGVVTVIYKYDNFPRQITLFDSFSMNAFKVPISHIPDNYPYFYVKFDNFNGKIATFTIYLFNNKGVYAKKLF